MKAADKGAEDTDTPILLPPQNSAGGGREGEGGEGREGRGGKGGEGTASVRTVGAGAPLLLLDLTYVTNIQYVQHRRNTSGGTHHCTHTTCL